MSYIRPSSSKILLQCFDFSCGVPRSLEHHSRCVPVCQSLKSGYLWVEHLRCGTAVSAGAGSGNDFHFQGGLAGTQLTLTLLTWLRGTGNGSAVGIWVHHCRRVVGLKIQLPASLAPIDARGSSQEDQIHQPRGPPSFLSQVFGVYLLI